MSIHRLLEIVYILLDKREITAKELAEYFGVSQRTIYRDIDSLSVAGIPIYTVKGKGGGIRLLENYTLSKTLLSEKEQLDILSSLQSLKALNVPDVELVLAKLTAMFDINNTDWIDVDFSQWGSGVVEKEKFNLLKTAILNRNVVAFDYYSSYGEKSYRIIEPIRLLFKGQAWYVNGFCRTKDNLRLFKISRIKNLTITNETFSINEHDDIGNNPQDPTNNLTIKMATLVLKIDPCMAYRVYDEFDQDSILHNKDGSFTVTVTYPENEWLYGYVLSFGEHIEVIEPKYVREIIKKKLEENLRKYL
ncbi:helix-turn-helix transcriptional regulator [Cytobacillus sp. Hz8]|uniref:helix-turn-helix transcriptional regulator n=1 Tax=Cytobacillus sp. Hz8 TaxID=3347168 RepID=UPI0035DE609D